MNELLGWYGYDKVELRDSEANEMRNYRERRQHVSVLKGKGECTEQVPQVSMQTWHIKHAPITSQVSLIQTRLMFLDASATNISGGHPYECTGVCLRH